MSTPSPSTDNPPGLIAGLVQIGGGNNGDQDERRKQIREIMKDPYMSQSDKSRMIQSLMDGRRRSSSGGHSICSSEGKDEVEPSEYVSSMAAAARAAAEYYSSDDEGDAIMSEAPDDVSYGYDRWDDRSNTSSVTPTSHHSNPGGAAQNTPNHPPAGTYRQVHGRSFSLQDWTDQKRAAATHHTTSFLMNFNPAQVSRLMEKSRPPCTHYERNCTIISPCCGLAFGCRICHDECEVLPPPLSYRKTRDAESSGLAAVGANAPKKSTPFQKAERRRSMPLDLGDDDDGAETHHLIDRFMIREVICRECCTRQSSKTNYCITCGVRFGAYHCNICNLWMSDSESPYHCEDCGFCRVGGRENFKHCRECGMCIDALLFEDHNCRNGKYMSDCPICQEDLFSSREASHEMPCGHAIHWHCFKELTSFDTRCPVCKKTAEPPEQMASTWSAIAMGIALQPVPPDLARLVHILCNDCEERDHNRRWHFLGVRCMHCLSFNTNVEQIVMVGRDAAEMLDQLEARMATQAGGVPANIIASSSMMDEDVPSGQETSSGGTDVTNGNLGFSSNFRR